MLLGFVLLGRSLEESARLKASSDMNELVVSIHLIPLQRHLFFICRIKVSKYVFPQTLLEKLCSGS
jgi:hypothetical protein